MEEKMKADEQTVRDITARIALLPTTDDIASVRRDFNEKVCFRTFPILLLCLCDVLSLRIRFVAISKKVFNNMMRLLHKHLLNLNNVLIMYVLI
jgi:hypothetical protein